MPPRKPGPESNVRQTKLFQPDAVGEVVNPAAIPSDTNPSVLYPQSNLYERSQHLFEATKKFGDASKNASLAEGVRQQYTNQNTPRGRAVRKQAKRKGLTLDEAGEVWENKRVEYMVDAEKEFYRAFGYEALVAAGLDPEEVSVMMSEDFNRFVRKYADSDNSGDREDYRRDLRKQQRGLKKAKADIEKGVKPGEQLSEIQVAPNQLKTRDIENATGSQESRELELDTLDVKDRLRILREDSRAGLIPFTRKELWQATELLTFLPGKDEKRAKGYPGGVAKYLNNILLHNKNQDEERDDGVDTATRAPISVVYEFGDYAIDAAVQRKALIELDELIRELPNPAPKLVEEFENGHPAFAALLRYRDVLALREVGGDKSDFDESLLTVIEELMDPEDEGYETERHKRIHSPYTAPELSEQMGNKIEDFMQSTSVGSIRELIVEAIENEGARLEYWTNVLEGSKQHMGAKPTAEKVLEELEALK